MLMPLTSLAAEEVQRVDNVRYLRAILGIVRGYAMRSGTGLDELRVRIRFGIKKECGEELDASGRVHLCQGTE